MMVTPTILAAPAGPATASIAHISQLPALLQLADGRFPTGGHAHSGGFEAAAEREHTTDAAGLDNFLRGRLHTTGLVMAAFTAAACQIFTGCIGSRTRPDPDTIADLDAEYEARTPSPVLRTVSRRLGRQIVRAGRTVWPDAVLDTLASLPGNGVHQPIGFGAVAAAAGQTPLSSALLTAQESIAGPATASIRLLGLDPFEVNAVVAGLAADTGAIAEQAAGCASAPPAELPTAAGYLLDIAAEYHATWEVRLFAS
jgi:urease accessory protein